VEKRQFALRPFSEKHRLLEEILAGPATFQPWVGLITVQLSTNPLWILPKIHNRADDDSLRLHFVKDAVGKVSHGAAAGIGRNRLELYLAVGAEA
jgi:hypothetical protein